MKSSSQGQTYAFGAQATAFVETLLFDMELQCIGRRVEQVSIARDAPDDWESESVKVIHYVRYEYTRVSKKNPETRRSGQAMINRARDKVKFLTSVATSKDAVLKVVKKTLVVRLQPNVDAFFDITLSYLEDSYGSLISDPIASLRKTRDIPAHLKEKANTASKKGASKSTRRRTK